MTWSPDQFVAKAKCYIERGLREDPGTATRAWWFHFSVEPLLRAAVAKKHPALLANPRSIGGLMAALGEEPLGVKLPLSRGLGELLKDIVPLIVPGFDDNLARRAATLIARRNSELHGPDAAFEGLGDEEWMSDFLRVALAICSYLQKALDDLVGVGFAEHARAIADEDEAATKHLVGRLLTEAQSRFAGPKVGPYSGVMTLVYDGGAVTRFVPCPACEQPGALSGRSVHQGPARLEEGLLSRAVTVAASRFQCKHCGLHLVGGAQIGAAGLQDTFESVDELDPWEALGLDAAEEVERMGLIVIDPDEGRGYEDE